MESLIRFGRIVLPIGLLLTAAVVIPVKLLDSRGLERVDRLERELENLEEINRQIERENRALLTEIRSFHSNSAYIEKVARDELGMVGPGEYIYQFQDEGVTRVSP